MISGPRDDRGRGRGDAAGAFDFMEKPLDRNRVMVTLRNALERRKMWREVHDLRAPSTRAGSCSATRR